MQRTRLQISVVVAVLALGATIGWFAGEPVTPHPSALGNLPVVMEMVVEEEAGESIKVMHKANSAFQMPYFSFKVRLPQPPSRPGT